MNFTEFLTELTKAETAEVLQNGVHLLYRRPEE